MSLGDVEARARREDLAVRPLTIISSLRRRG